MLLFADGFWHVLLPWVQGVPAGLAAANQCWQGAGLWMGSGEKHFHQSLGLEPESSPMCISLQGSKWGNRGSVPLDKLSERRELHTWLLVKGMKTQKLSPAVDFSYFTPGDFWSVQSIYNRESSTWGFLGVTSSKEPACQWRKHSETWVWLFPGLGTSPGEGHGNPLQYSCLENPMHRGAWQATVHRVAKSQTRLKQLSMHARI